MARRQHHNSISLFPFLAVLVCAMGSLILLLLIMTRKIRQDQHSAAMREEARAEAPPDRSAEISEQESLVAAARSRADQLQQQVQSLQQEVDIQRQQLKLTRQELAQLQTTAGDSKQPAESEELTTVLREIRKLKAEEVVLLSQLTETEKRLFSVQQELAVAEKAVENAEIRLKEKHSALLSLRAQVQKASEERVETAGSKTLLEFSNSTGTNRTPIVVEVSSKGFLLLPNEILIRSEDMEGFPVRDNPFLSAVVTAHRHRSGNSMTSEPYVLLIVRPDGSLQFYGAQRVLVEAKIHYGYELLTADQDISAGAKDPTETAPVQSALTEAFERREKLYAKLMAIVQQHQEASSAAGGGGEKRRMAVRPDGRVVEEPSGRIQLPGQFYAGGVAPPPSHYKNRASALSATTSEDRLTPAEAAHLAEQFAAQYAKRQQEELRSQGGAQTRSADSAIAKDSAITKSTGASGQETKDQNTELPSSEQPSPEKQLADRVFESDGSLQTSPIFRESRGSAEEESAVPISEAEKWLRAGASGSAANAGTRPNPDAPFSVMPDLTRIDPDLLRQMPAGKRPSSSMSIPIGITVFLDEKHMTIGQQRATAIQPDNLNEEFASLLKGINTEVDDSRQKPGEPLMPIVKFVVSPGGEKWRVPLAQGLKQVGIRSVSTVELAPYITVVDDTGRAVLPTESQP